MSSSDHLSEAAKAALLLSDDDRINYILKDRWIGYDKANQIMAKLEDLITHPKIGRMPNMLIIAASNYGKSRLANHFASKHPATDNSTGDRVKVPVLLLHAPSSADIAQLYRMILNLLFTPYKPNSKLGELEEQVIQVLSKIDLGIIIIDEINNLISGTVREQRIFLNSLKTLGNRAQVPIVGVGTEEAFRAFQTDVQMANRYIAERLPKWNLDKEFLKFIASLEKIIPLKNPSNLIQREIATKIYAMSEGIIGEISNLINDAAVWAIRNAKEKNIPECISIEALNSCGYKSPSMRSRTTP